MRAALRRGVLVASAAALALGTLGCSAGPDGEGTTTVTVFAAASLRTAFEEIGREFEAEHDGVRVAFSFAGSSDLVAQVQQGAGADVVASADTATMGRLVAEDLVDEPRLFAANSLEIVVPPGNPAGVGSLTDLTGAGVQLVTCAPEVPCGAAAARVEAAAGLDLRPVSEEHSVTDVLNKVVTGEADAGLVYATDVIAAGDAVQGIPFREATSSMNDYPIARVLGTGQAGLADAFVSFVLGERGQAVLTQAGFATP